MIIGVDVGYTYTKTATKEGEDIFRSTIKEGSLDINKSITVEYQGKEYTIGEKGSYSVDLNKTQDETFLLCLYTAIVKAMNSNSEEIDLVTGLPVAYYSSQKQILKDSLEGKDIFIKLDGRHKIFNINRCLVFPQSAGLFTVYPEIFQHDVLVIDIGGMTVDVGGAVCALRFFRLSFLLSLLRSKNSAFMRPEIACSYRLFGYRNR